MCLLCFSFFFFSHALFIFSSMEIPMRKITGEKKKKKGKHLLIEETWLTAMLICLEKRNTVWKLCIHWSTGTTTWDVYMECLCLSRTKKIWRLSTESKWKQIDSLKHVWHCPQLGPVNIHVHQVVHYTAYICQCSSTFHALLNLISLFCFLCCSTHLL